jgi:hypothetical protein
MPDEIAAMESVIATAKAKPFSMTDVVGASNGSPITLPGERSSTGKCARRSSSNGGRGDLPNGGRHPGMSREQSGTDTQSDHEVQSNRRGLVLLCYSLVGFFY